MHVAGLIIATANIAKIYRASNRGCERMQVCMHLINKGEEERKFFLGRSKLGGVYPGGGNIMKNSS